jgi:hypothetical protein
MLSVLWQPTVFLSSCSTTCIPKAENAVSWRLVYKVIVSSIAYLSHLCSATSIQTIYCLVTSAMLSGFWNLGRSSVRPSTTFLQGRMFHACNVDHTTLPKDPVKQREILDEQIAARRLQRLENPIEFRNRSRTYKERYYHGGKPEIRERIAQYRQRADVKERKNNLQRTLAYKRVEALRRFVIRRPEVSRHLTWRTHMPVTYGTRTKHECASCHKHPYLGFKLWWKRHDNTNHIADHNSTDIYDCHACFTADWSRTSPIGYEDFEFGQGKIFRLREETESGSTTSDSKKEGK